MVPGTSAVGVVVASRFKRGWQCCVELITSATECQSILTLYARYVVMKLPHMNHVRHIILPLSSAVSVYSAPIHAEMQGQMLIT